VFHFLVRENWCNPILLQFLFLFIEGPFLFWSLRRVESSSKYYDRPGDPDAVACGGQGYEPGAEHFEQCQVIINTGIDRFKSSSRQIYIMARDTLGRYRL
jgi:hypothetical protein